MRPHHPLHAPNKFDVHLRVATATCSCQPITSANPLSLGPPLPTLPPGRDQPHYGVARVGPIQPAPHATYQTQFHEHVARKSNAHRVEVGFIDVIHGRSYRGRTSVPATWKHKEEEGERR